MLLLPYLRIIKLCFDKKFDFDLNFDGSMVRCPLKVNAKVKFQDFLSDEIILRWLRCIRWPDLR